MSLQLHVIFEGTGAAFFRKPGCPCDRCRMPSSDLKTADEINAFNAFMFQANTAASLIITQDGVPVDHTLVDCGQGVVQNLVGRREPEQSAPINRVLLTHGHFDHIAGLDALLHSLKLGLKSGDLATDHQPWPLPIYATRQTWQRTIGPNPEAPEQGGHFRYMLDNMRHVDVTAAARAQTPLQLHPALSVQPIPVEHYLDSVHYRFTFWPSGQAGEGESISVALCWDLMAYPHGRRTDVWQGVVLDPASGWLHEQMHGVDLLALEMTTWRSVNAGHVGFLGPATTVAAEPGAYGVRDLVQMWQPRQIRVVHYDGWDDRLQHDGRWTGAEQLRDNHDPARGPVLDSVLRRALQASLGNEVAIDVGSTSEIITFG